MPLTTGTHPGKGGKHCPVSMLDKTEEPGTIRLLIWMPTLEGKK
jgi:hypothetical protein